MVPLLILYFRNNINDFVTLHLTMAMFKVIKRYIKVNDALSSVISR